MKLLKDNLINFLPIINQSKNEQFNNIQNPTL